MAFNVTPYIGGMPLQMSQLLQEKYRQSNVQTNAQAAQAYSAANLNNQNAAVVKPTAVADIAKKNADTRYTNTQNSWYGEKTGAEIAYNRAAAEKYMADAALGRAGLPYVGAKSLSDIYQNLGAGNQANAMAGAMNRGMENGMGSDTRKPTSPTSTQMSLPSLMSMVSAPPPAPVVVGGGSTAPNITIQKSDSTVSSLLDSPSNFMAMSRTSPIKPIFSEDEGLMRSSAKNALDPLKFKRGTARVPGKGAGDKVPAMLEPNEAILNKHAADIIGRDKIAKANAKGNQARQKQDTLKIVQMLKSMSSGMV